MLLNKNFGLVFLVKKQEKSCFNLVFVYNKRMNTILWSKKAIKQRRKLDKVSLKRIDLAVDGFVDNNFLKLSNVKALNNHAYDYRLKVGNYRVLFNHDSSVQIVSIEEVKKRDERTYSY